MKFSYFLGMSLTAALFAGALSAGAAQLTPDEALRRATGGKAFVPSMNLADNTFKLKYTVTAKGDEAAKALYVFEPRKGGYIVVSADDCAEPLLGYSASGTFDADAMPPAMAWWFDEYARQIEAARRQPVLKAIERPERAPIAPMVKTKWNQDAPYNTLCPVYNGSRSVTGCVATAMAQVVKYHEWPATGTGSHEYYYNGGWISLDFSKINFDWNNMLDSYADGAGTERQKIAVAQLMYACGVGVDMQYSPVESGAADIFVASALVDYFNYDKNVRYAERDYFGLLDWEEFIYNQLRDYGPVQYSGSSSLGGHSFVCDGYSEDGYFHFNWGWGGVSDGYFLLTALDPPMQGIGGANSGYNFNQAVIGNIRKPKVSSQMYLNLMMDQGFIVEPVKTTTSTRPGDQIRVASRVVNMSIGTASGSLGVKFTNKETGEVKYGTSSTRFTLQSLTLTQGYTTQIPSTLRAGTYDLTPVMCGTDGVWKDLPVKLSAVQRVVMTIKSGVCTFENGVDGTVTVTDVQLHTPVYLGNLFRLTATVTNPGDNEFVGQLVPTLASGNTPVAKASPLPVDLMPGESIPVDITDIFNHFSSSTLPPAGKYTLFMVKEATNEIVSQGIEVELHGVPENTSLTVNEFSIDGEPRSIDKTNVVFNCKLTCDAGYVGRNLSVVIFPYQSGQVSAVGFFNTPDVFLSEGESTTFSTGGNFAAGEPGKTYFAVLFDGQSPLTSSGQEVVFTLAKQDGVGSVDTPDSPVSKTRVFSLQGVLLLECEGAQDINNTSLAAGVYIIETVKSDGTRSVDRVLKR